MSNLNINPRVLRVILTLVMILLLHIMVKCRCRNRNNSSHQMLELFQDVVNQDEFIDYRFSDIFREWSSASKGTPYRESFLKRFPNTLGGKYLRKYKKNKDFKTLNEIIDEEYVPKLDSLPDENTVVVHLRIGDVILKKKDKVEGKKYHEYDILIKPWFTYGWQPSKYENLAKKLHEENPNYQVILVFGAHFDENKEISEDYVEDIATIFRDRGFKVQEKHTGNPDMDFSYMSQAKIWVPGGGGFANLITDNLNFKKAKVYQVKDY